MLDELAATIAFPAARPGARHSDAPLPLRLAVPLIGSVSIGLWVLLGKAAALLLA